MNRWTVLIASLLVIMLASVAVIRGQPAPLDPDSGKSRRTIVAEGSATITGKPDSARVHLSVVSRGKTVAEARQQTAQAVAKMQAAILSLKLGDLKTRTTDTHVSIIHDDRERYQVAGYQVSQSLSVLVNQVDPAKLGEAAGQILDAGLDNGANNDGQIEFFKANDDELRRQAMEKAVEDALANARAYANGAKVKIAEVIEINGEYAPRQFIFGQLGGFTGGEAKSTVVAGEWNVYRQVRVVCRY